MPQLLRFGIPSFDTLLTSAQDPNAPGRDVSENANKCGIQIPQAIKGEPEPSLSICLMGPDGTGKSVFSLHLASRYLADCIFEDKTKLPLVLYVSTDLTFPVACRTWENFALGTPNIPRDPFHEHPDDRPGETIKLSLCKLESVHQQLEQREETVHFIDLASKTAGDDWGFLHRLLSILDTPEPGRPRHLVIIDAVEGFETLGGELNAFGEKASRRSRIAQVMRLVNGKCHAAFVVEEAKPNERHPEQFVTDAVIRLHKTERGGFSRRTVEVEKARGQSYARGPHSYAIRSGRGSTTGEQGNNDDPVWYLPDNKTERSYVYVFHSLHHFNRTIMERRGQARPEPPENEYAAFGIPYLDNMLAGENDGDLRDFDSFQELDFSAKDFKDVPGLMKKLAKGEAGSIYAHIRDSLDSYNKLDELTLDKRRDALKSAFDKLLDDPALLAAEKLKNIPLSARTTFFRAQRPTGSNPWKRLRRMVLEDAFAGEIERKHRFYDKRGLPTGTITAVIGDSLTQKSRLGYAFLSRCFASAATSLVKVTETVNDKCRQSDFDSLAQTADASWPCSIDAVNLAIADKWQKIIATWRDCAKWENNKAAGLPDVEVVKGSLPKFKPTDFPPGHRPTVEELTIAIKAKTAAWLLGPMDGVAVMLTTYDTHHKNLATHFMQLLLNDKVLQEWLDKTGLLKSSLKESRTPSLADLDEVYQAALRRYIEDYTICRRLEIHDVIPSGMIHIFDRTIEAAQKLIVPNFVKNSKDAFVASHRIRIVLDDFSTMVNTYSELRSEPLLLPSLMFLLGRSGASTLIIDTQTGNPDITLAERFESELRELVQNRIYTWRVPFYGENRVALTAIPPISPEYAGLVRELKWESKKKSDPLIVDPHFELYSGLEEGNPQPVPLEIRCYSELPWFDAYVARENIIFNDLFVPAASAGRKDVIVGYPADEYDSLRNSCYLQRGTRLDHTLIYQVDEFWGARLPDPRRTGAFRPQWDYLSARTRSRNERDKNTDPFSLFQQGFSDDGELRRFEAYHDVGYGLSPDHEDRLKIDRVPFSWDFGFMVCRKSAWEGDVQLTKMGRISQSNKTVSQVLSDLQNPDETVSWRDFLEACRQVAMNQSIKESRPVPALDLSQLSPESLSCLILEIWASEIYQSLNDKETFRQQLSERTWTDTAGHSLNAWIDDYRPQLYLTWLLLADVLDFSRIAAPGEIEAFSMKPRFADPAAVAARHWYKTAACWIEDNSPQHAVVPVRLPGHFSVRGDWFLAVAGGSRSSRLADRALDLLSSRRANIVRLQEGLGLPVRRLTAQEPHKLRTRLICVNDKGHPESLEYGELLKLGAEENSHFHWLWRSSLKNYHRQCRIWHKWLKRVCAWWLAQRQTYDAEWKSGFHCYDHLKSEIPNGRQQGGWENLRKKGGPWRKKRVGETADKVMTGFSEMCDFLKLELEAAFGEDEGKIR